MRFSYVDGWGRVPSDISFLEVAGIALDSRDNVHAFCRGDDAVVVFTPDGEFVRTWGRGLFTQAHGITIDPEDNLWLTDSGDHTIRKFTNTGHRPPDDRGQRQPGVIAKRKAVQSANTRGHLPARR